MKFVVYYKGSDPGLNERIKEIAIIYRGQAMDSEFMGGETSFVVSFENEGLFDHFLRDTRSFAKEINIQIFKSGYVEINP